jgi:hypothetical protein
MLQGQANLMYSYGKVIPYIDSPNYHFVKSPVELGEWRM